MIRHQEASAWRWVLFGLGVCFCVTFLAARTAIAQEGSGHERFIRTSYDLARSAGQKGNHPFGALLVHKGKVILEAENTVYSSLDFTRHAEINLMAEARRSVPRAVIQDCTVYSSAAPCPMCSAALAHMGVRRVVYGVSYKAMGRIFGMPEEPLPLDMLYRLKKMEVEFLGPVLEQEGIGVFALWPEREGAAAQFIRTNAQGLAAVDGLR